MNRKRIGLAAALACLLAASTALLAQQPKPDEKDSGKICTLTGKKVDACCCEKQGEKLFCTLAKKEVSECCCEQSKAEKKNDTARECCQKHNSKSKSQKQPGKPKPPAR